MSHAKSIFALLALSFFLISIPPSYAALRPELAVNDELKICKTFEPSGLYDLPAGWRYYKAEGDFMTSQHKSACESMGYTYMDERLGGVIKPYYNNWIIVLDAVFFGSADGMPFHCL
jgi:hypothetical protein